MMDLFDSPGFATLPFNQSLTIQVPDVTDDGVVTDSVTFMEKASLRLTDADSDIAIRSTIFSLILSVREEKWDSILMR
jgi:hypothetical protein